MIKDKRNIGMVGSIILIIGIGISIYFIMGIEKEKIYRTMMLDNKVATFMVDSEVYTRIAIIDGKLESNPDIPEKENYTFDHWEINGKRYNENTKLNEDTIVTAVFKKENETSSTTPVSNPTNNKIIVTGISIDKTSVNMSIGESISLKGTIIPSNATNKKISWISSNSSIVTVDNNGKITGVESGNAIITARTSNGKEATCSVNVTGNTIDVTGISLDKKDVSINVGDSLILNSEITPANASNKTVTWQSSNSKIVEVTQSGKITGKSSGTATITVKTSNGKEAKCTVKVNSNTIEVKSVSLSRTNVSLEVGKSITIEASVSPSNATNKNISWQSSNNSVAKVSNGKITGVGSGTATITAVAHNGKGKECQVTVSGASAVMATGITLNSQSLSMIVGDKTTLKATITPSNTTDKKITWTSSNTQSVTIDQNGAVTAIGVGESTITAKVGNVKDECKITVKEKTVLAESILLKPTTVTIDEGTTTTIAATISPNNTTDKTITWISSNSNIATVSKKGVVKGISKGTVSITAKTSNGKSVTAQVTVKSVKKIGSIKFTSSKVSVFNGFEVKNNLIKVGDGAVSYKSSDTNVATVDNHGNVKLKNIGTTTITATVTNSSNYTYESKSATYKLIVKYNNIAYSSILNSGFSKNSREHFDAIAKMSKYDTLKADLQPTKDGGIILCHDSAFTLDSTKKKILSYKADSSNNVLINTLTEQEAFNLIHNKTGNHVTNFEYFIKTCKENNKYAFITVRVNLKNSKLISKMLEIIKNYNMLDKSIINSFSLETLKEVRKQNSNIMLSYVVTGSVSKTSDFNKTAINEAAKLKRCIVSAYIFKTDNDRTKLISSLKNGEFHNIIKYAKEKNVIVYGAIISNKDDVDLSKYGISGAQISYNLSK